MRISPLNLCTEALSGEKPRRGKGQKEVKALAVVCAAVLEVWSSLGWLAWASARAAGIAQRTNRQRILIHCYLLETHCLV